VTLRRARIAPGRPQSISHGVIAVTFASAIFMASGYVVNVWLGRLLGPADYGRFGVVIALMTVLNIIQNAAIPQAVARATAQFPEAADGTLRRGVELQLGLAALLMVGLVIGAPAIADLLGERQLVGLLWLSATVLLPYGLLTLLIAFHNGRRFYTRQALTQAAYAIAKAIGAIGLAYGFRLTGAIIGYLAAAIIGLIVGWHRIWAPRSSVSYRQLLSFAGPLSIYAVASTGLMSVDIFFVKAMSVSEETAGYYAASQNIARIPFFLMTGLAAVILPAVAAATKRGGTETANTTARALRWALIIVVPIVAITAATGPPLVELVYSSRYRPAGEILVLLGPAMGILAVSSIVAGALGGIGRVAACAGLAVVGVAVTTVGCFVLVPLAAAFGAALATLIGSLVTLVGMLAILWRSVPGSLPLASAARVSAAAIVVGVVAWLISADGAMLVVAYALLGVLLGGILLAARELTIDELNALFRGERGRRHG
jgi:O-antigen/teichoic acid export membrane protein